MNCSPHPMEVKQAASSDSGKRHLFVKQTSTLDLSNLSGTQRKKNMLWFRESAKARENGEQYAKLTAEAVCAQAGTRQWEGMSDDPPRIAAGFPEMWQPVYLKYRALVEVAGALQPFVNEITDIPVKGLLHQTVCRMVLAGANAMGAMVTLVLNGYGHDAMKLARSIFEIELNILWLKKHPEDIDDFVEYTFIQQKQLYDVMSEEQQKQVPPQRYQQMMDRYNEALKRFATGRDKTRPRNEWCRVSLYERAKQVDRLELYRTFYREASGLHHADISGLISQVDDQMDVELAPTWGKLDEALMSGIGSFLRCVNDYDELAQLGYAERLQNGPNEDYVKALKAL